MANFYPKTPLVMNRALEVQRLSIPLLITANATPASKVVTVDEPGILFVNVQGITGISVANGALASTETPPALATATDSTGVINVEVLINEVLVKVMHIELITRNLNASPLVIPGQILAFSTGAGVSGLVGADLFANFTTGVNLGTTNLDACLVVEYIAAE